MQNLVRMQILNTHTHFQKELPNSTFCQLFSHLPFEVESEIPIFTVFHDDVYLVSISERIVKLDNIGAINL